MATRSKTIEYHFQTDVNTLAAAVRRDLPAITVYIPETIVAFRSVEVRAVLAQDVSVAASLTNWIIGIKLGAVAFNDVTVTDTMTNSGEADTYVLNRDVTSYFTTNWAGTSMTCQVGLSTAGTATQNHCAKLLITYDYDDASATHIKTIRIPIESTRNVLTTAWQTVGGATAIPALTGSYLPEASVVIRQIAVELWGDEGTASTGDFIAEARINGGAAMQWWDSESALASSRWAYGVIDITAEDLSVARSLECEVLTTTSRMNQVGGLIVVTYEFNPSTSTIIYNSFMIGAVDTIAHMHGTAAADNDRWGRTFYIQEPATITLRESAACLFMMSAGGFSASVRVGSQGYTTRPFTTGTTQDGQFSLVHRMDAGGTAGTAGISLARGVNSYVLDWYSNSITEGWNLNGFAIINYTSGKATAGVGAHNHTIYKSLRNVVADARVVTTSSQTTIDIPETNYYLTSAIIYSPYMQDDSTTTASAIDAERLAGEAEGDGWENIFAGMAFVDGENRVGTTYGATRRVWKRWTGDPDTDRMAIETARRIRIMAPSAAWIGLGVYVTYHAITYTIGGSLTDSLGGTVTLNVHRVATNELVLTGSRVGNGAYSFTWYDNTEEVYVTAYEGITRLGRSANDLAS